MLDPSAILKEQTRTVSKEYFERVMEERRIGLSTISPEMLLLMETDAELKRIILDQRASVYRMREAEACAESLKHKANDGIDVATLQSYIKKELATTRYVARTLLAVVLPAVSTIAIFSLFSIPALYLLFTALPITLLTTVLVSVSVYKEASRKRADVIPRRKEEVITEVFNSSLSTEELTYVRTKRSGVFDRGFESLSDFVDAIHEYEERLGKTNTSLTQ